MAYFTPSLPVGRDPIRSIPHTAKDQGFIINVYSLEAALEMLAKH